MSEAEKTYMALPRETTLDDHMAELRTSVTLGLCGLLRILQPGSKKTGKGKELIKCALALAWTDFYSIATSESLQEWHAGSS